MSGLMIAKDPTSGKYKELIVDSNGALEVNAVGVELHAGDISISVDGLEALQATNNTKTTSIDTRIDSIIGATNNTASIGDGQSQLKAMCLGYDRSGAKARSILVDSGGIVATHDTVAESSLNSLVSANHTDLVALEASLTSMEGKIDTLDVVQDNALTKLTNVETLITQLDVVADASLVKHTNNETLLTAISVDGNAVQTLLTQLDVVADASLVKQTNIETLITTLDGVQDNALTKLTNVETLITTLDGVQDNALTKLTNLETLITQLDVVADASLVKHTNNETLLTAISVDGNSVQTLLTQLDVVADASLVKQTNIETLITSTNSKVDDIDGLISDNKDLLTAIDSDTDNIKTATQLVATAVDTNSSNATAVRSDVYFEGVASETNSGNKNNNCQRVVLATDDIPTALTNSRLNTAIGHLSEIEGAVESLESCINSNKVKVEFEAGNLNIGNVDVASSALPSGASTESTVSAMSAKLPASLGQKANANCISTCRSSTAGAYDLSGRTTIGTASTTTKLLCDSDGHLKVDIVSGGGGDLSGISTHAKQDTIIGHLDGVEGKLDTIETTNNACQVLLGTIDSDTDAIKTSTAACATDLAAIEVLSTAANVDLAAMEVLLTAANVDHAANEVLLTAISADGNAIQTKLDTIETTLTEIAPRQAVSAVYTNSSLADDASSSTIDTDDFSFMTICASQGSANLPLEIQYSINDSNWFKVRSKLLTFSAYEGGSWADIVLEHPMRYVRVRNTSGSDITNLHLSYQLSN